MITLKKFIKALLSK